MIPADECSKFFQYQKFWNKFSTLAELEKKCLISSNRCVIDSGAIDQMKSNLNIFLIFDHTNYLFL